MPTCAEKIFTNVKLNFRVNIKNTITEYYGNSEDEEEHPLCLAVMPPNNINNNKARTIPPKEEIFAVLRDQSVDISKRAFLKRKAMEPSSKTKFMRNFVRHEAEIDKVL